MKMIIGRVLMVSMFGVGCGLFIYGVTDFKSGLSGGVLLAGNGGELARGFAWSVGGRYFMSIGAFLIGIPIAVHFTSNR